MYQHELSLALFFHNYICFLDESIVIALFMDENNIHFYIHFRYFFNEKFDGK